eukprot:jgi/Botrbrau1/7593/Bobra.0159s0042.1
MLAQGGEFAFVMLSLAKELKVLPDELNRLLIIVVVLSMALTPSLADLGSALGEYYRRTDRDEEGEGVNATLDELHLQGSPIVICGFGELGQTIANMLQSPLAQGLGGPGGVSPSYVAFDLQPVRVKTAREMGFNVQYGDASRPMVLHAAGVENPQALAVVYTARGRAVTAVRSLREGFPTVPIYARALDSQHAAELKAAGATNVITSNVEAGLQLTSELLESLGAKRKNIEALTSALRTQLELRSTTLASHIATGSHDSVASSENDVFKLDEESLPQEAKGFLLQSSFDGILARGAAFLTGEWAEEDPNKPLDPLLAAYRGMPSPLPDEKVLDALRDGSVAPETTAAATAAAIEKYTESSGRGTSGANGQDAYAMLGTTAVGPAPGTPSRNGNGVKDGPPAGPGKSPGRDVEWFVNQNLSSTDRDGVIECPIEDPRTKDI